ncbi:vacuolar ATPase assembly integral membrane protein vma21 [Oleoguttula sp. CCFEE 5521]
MATQRPLASSEKAPSHLAPPPPNPKSNITPAVPASVIFKLLAFTFAMITLPIGSYFLSVKTIFKERPGNSTYAGALAAIMANVVLIGYVVVAFNDDKSEREEAEEERKKDR